MEYIIQGISITVGKLAKYSAALLLKRITLKHLRKKTERSGKVRKINGMHQEPGFVLETTIFMALYLKEKISSD